MRLNMRLKRITSTVCRPVTLANIALMTMLALLIACAPNLLPQAPTPNTQPTTASALTTAMTEKYTTEKYTVSSAVTRGEFFAHDFTPNLTFQLIPLQYGWQVWVGDPTTSLHAADNFAMPGTPPFSGINARQVEGWHFRNLDNSGPNVAGVKNVNAPQTLRHFCFVGDHADFQNALVAFAAGLPVLANAVSSGALPLYSGTLNISDYTLGTLIPEQKARIEQMTFTVTLNLDQPCTLF